MNIFRLAVFGVLAVSLTLLVRTYRPEMALQISIITSLLLLVYIIGELSGVIENLRSIANRFGMNTGYIGMLIKIIGIAYIAQFATDICRDAGESSIASKVELGGRIMILAAALPAAIQLLELISSLLPQAVQ